MRDSETEDSGSRVGKELGVGLRGLKRGRVTRSKLGRGPERTIWWGSVGKVLAQGVRVLLRGSGFDWSTDWGSGGREKQGPEKQGLGVGVGQTANRSGDRPVGVGKDGLAVGRGKALWGGGVRDLDGRT
jgi:hypothetical protein